MDTQNEHIQKISDLTIGKIASICDHTFLNRPEAYKHVAKSGESSIKLHEQALENFLKETLTLENKPYAVCVRPEGVDVAITTLKNSSILVASVVGFPDGTAYDTEFRRAEAKFAIRSGAHEIDMILDYSQFKNGNYDYIRYDISEMVDVTHLNDVKLKLILETSELTPNQIMDVCILANDLNVDFVKTSTGFSASGAKADDLQIMRTYFDRGVKISGGVNIDNVKDLLYAASGRNDGYINLDPNFIRIGESSLLKNIKTDY